MGRMVRIGLGRARLTLVACSIGLGLLSLISLVGAQGASDENVVTIERPSLDVYLSLLPGATDSELELRVTIKQPVTTPPQAEFHDAADGQPRAVTIAPAPAEPGVWVGTITQVELYGVGYVYVTATADSGQVERHKLSFATRGTFENQASVAYSAEGRFGLVVLPGDVPVKTRFLVTTLESPVLSLPTGVKVEAGPFEVMATEPIPDPVEANIAIVVDKASPGTSPPAYQVRWLNPATSAWEILPADIGSHSPVAQAGVTHLGTFVLTSEAI